MVKNELVKDLATLTTIHENALNQLFSKINDIVCYKLQEAKLAGKDTVEVDVFVGTLIIKFNEIEARYKFIPSSKLEEQIKNTLTSPECDLVLDVEEALKDKILNVYKDLF